jgi:hypothetical protein
MDSLSTELITIIISYVSTVRNIVSSNRNLLGRKLLEDIPRWSLKQASLVNRRFRDIALPFLFEHIILALFAPDTSEFWRLIQFSRAREVLALSTRRVTIKIPSWVGLRRCSTAVEDAILDLFKRLVRIEKVR